MDNKRIRDNLNEISKNLDSLGEIIINEVDSDKIDDFLDVLDYFLTITDRFTRKYDEQLVHKVLLALVVMYESKIIKHAGERLC